MFNFLRNKIYKIDKNGNKKRVFFIWGIRFSFKGKNSVVEIHEPLAKFDRCRIACGNNCFVSIGASPYRVKRLRVLTKGDNSSVKIGKDFSLTNNCEIVTTPEKNLNVSIGDNCQFGLYIYIRATDGHKIISLEDGTVLNKGKDVVIGNHCWVASNVKILKGSTIASGSVVGMSSVVAGKCDTPNSVYAGNPAKLKKTNITWDRECP